MGAPHIEFLVEEPSMEVLLNHLLRRCLPKGCKFEIHPHQGKMALLRKLKDWLKGYVRCPPEDCRIVVVVDLDKDQYNQLKSRLEEACQQAGL